LIQANKLALRAKIFSTAPNAALMQANKLLLHTDIAAELPELTYADV
jgi:hypothetical protein